MCTASVRKKRVFAKKIVHPDCVLKIFAHTQHSLKKNQNCLIFFNPCKNTQKIKKMYQELANECAQKQNIFWKNTRNKNKFKFFYFGPNVTYLLRLCVIQISKPRVWGANSNSHSPFCSLQNCLSTLFGFPFLYGRLLNSKVLLHNDWFCNACTIKRSIILLCTPKQSTWQNGVVP